MIRVSDVAYLGNEHLYALDCLDSRQLSFGGYGRQFEALFAKYIGVRYAVAVNSGTAALHAALSALNIGRGDEVIVPATTYISTSYSVTYCGATPIFVDVRPDTWTICPDAIQRAITARTRAVIPVHLYGVPVEVFTVPSHVALIEDAAEAHGAVGPQGLKVGACGDVGAFSFFGNKIITCGEGGMVTTHDRVIAERVRRFRAMGHADVRYRSEELGYSYRMTNLSAAIGLAQLETIDEHLRIRETLYQRYRRNLPRIETQKRLLGSVAWVYPILVDDRDRVAQRLVDAGIETRPVFPPCHKQTAYAQTGASLPVSEMLGSRGLLLPLHANMAIEDVDTVCEKFQSCREK